MLTSKINIFKNILNESRKRTEHSFSYQQSNNEGLPSPAMSVQDCTFINSLETKKTYINNI